MKHDFKELIQKSYDFNQTVYNSDWKWKLLEELYYDNFVNSKDITPKIPKKIHQIWLGSPFPEKYRTWAESWQKLNPDWGYTLWTEANISEINLTDLSFYNNISNYGPKSDYLRYHILYQFGGFYLDTDFECLKSFESLRRFNFITGIGYPSKVELYIGLIGCVVGCPIMKRCIQEIGYSTKEQIQKSVFDTTSSYFFTRMFFNEAVENRKGVVALPPDYFYPFPNERGHQNRDGRSYIKKCSYAIHYWEVSWNSRIGNTDWIQGDQFKGIADVTYSPRIKHGDDYDNLSNTFDPSKIHEITFIYTHTVYVKQLFNIIKHLDGKFVIISHNCDVNIDASFNIPNNVIKWYAQNVNVGNVKLESIPIGIENGRWIGKTGKLIKMVELLKKPRKYINLVYLNCNIKTNSEKRQVVYDLFERTPWVTAERGKNGQDVMGYFYNVYNHKFVISPEGNGIDTHRTWECLYMGTIPIEKRNINNQFYNDLPICFVDEWEDITEEFLTNEWKRIKNSTWNIEKLNFTYWRNKISKIL